MYTFWIQLHINGVSRNVQENLLLEEQVHKYGMKHHCYMCMEGSHMKIKLLVICTYWIQRNLYGNDFFIWKVLQEDCILDSQH